MARKKKIATQKEVLEFYTDIMRRDIPDETVKLSEAMSAADKLYKHFKETTVADSDKKGTGVVLLPEVRTEGENK
ncbi:MAG: hypothetical protein IIX21_03770 [Clostridia bacterium]|nr:hypothetical protein [Clostridia bacterium]